jgi:hypothetical protein
MHWTNGEVNYEVYENNAQKIGKKLFIAYTGGGGPAPCGPADPHQGGRFPDLTVSVTAVISYPTTTTTLPASITGTIDYYYASGDAFANGKSGKTQVTPSRETMVEIFDSSKSTCSQTLLSTVYTSDTGEFTSTLSPGQDYVCVKIIAATSSSEIIPYPSTAAAKANGGAQLTDDAYASKLLGPVKISASGATNLSWKPAGVDDPLDQALDIDNALVTGVSWLSAYGMTPKFLNVLYPFPRNEDITNFNPAKLLGEINEDDAFDWSVLLHEYGHFVATQIGIFNTTPVTNNHHELYWNMADPAHEASKAQGLAIAWNEGFADFFSQMVQDVTGTSSLDLTDVGATPPIYVDYAPGLTTSFQLDVPGNTPPHPSLGEDNEASVARVLWSAFSLPTFSGIDGSVAFVKILARAMSSNDTRTLSGAVNALLAAAKATPWVPGTDPTSTNNVEVPANFHEEESAKTGGALLSSQNVAATITSAGVSDSGKSIALSWIAGQPSTAKDALNIFLVQFFNSSWTTLLSEQVEVVSTGTQSGSDLFKASKAIPSAWKKQSINVVVVGWNSGSTSGVTLQQLRSARSGPDPLTGPYISAPASIKIN